ncbi:prostatic acid phosphatase [Sphaerodactylus townsendi]|uniref:prostatic acid phosphatase n=1 Tax=Sphaerodactylus townsendi TaxID=933632 RepID=UPI00202752F2|nr:prostatic acid phosphatase [Sphaerodactylus townsendi]
MRETCRTSSSRSLHFCLLILFVLFFKSASGRKLTFAVVIYRHGDRSPIETYPNALHKESEWPQGFGQLTTLGMRQQYELGQYIKKRYSDFLSPTYKREEIYIQSTDVDRTIMSAQANLAGLFPPTTEEIWNPQIPWQPIPVHVVPKSFNPLFFYPRLDCPRFVKLMKESFSSGAFKLQLKNYMPLLGLIASKLRYDAKTLLDLNTHILWNFYDTLFVQKLHRRRNPHWADERMMGKLKSLIELAISTLFGEPKREEKSQLQGGLLVKDILKRIDNFVSNADPRKMMMYSAHDTTLIALQSALNVYDRKLPPYAACHIFELYQERNGQYTVEMQYLTSVTRAATPLTLPGCSRACPLDKFKQLLQPIIVDDWQAECNKA